MFDHVLDIHYTKFRNQYPNFLCKYCNQYIKVLFFQKTTTKPAFRGLTRTKINVGYKIVTFVPT